jgi:hypothetical protein
MMHHDGNQPFNSQKGAQSTNPPDGTNLQQSHGTGERKNHQGLVVESYRT